MRFLVTGDRNWTDGRAVDEILTVMPYVFCVKYEDTTLIHGAARGLDTIAAHHAALLGYKVEPYPAQWKEFGRAAGPIRNQTMLETGVDFCFAFHDHLDQSKGTKDMVKRCIKREIPTALYGHVEGIFSLITTWNWK